MSIFDELLKQVNSATDQELIRSTFSKYPTVVEDIEKGYLRQQDYSRKLNEFTTVKTQAEQLQAQLDTWKGWAGENWDATHNATKAEVALKAQVSELSEKLKLAESLGGEDVDWDKLKQTTEELITGRTPEIVKQTLAQAKVVTAEEMGQQLAAFGGGMEQFYADMYPLGFQHKDEFGEILQPREIFKVMGERKLTDPKAAYDILVADRRKAKQDADVEARITKAREEERQKVQTEMAMNNGPAGRLPVDNTGGVQGVGAVEAMLNRVTQPKDAANPNPALATAPELDGSGRLAREGFVQWQQKQAAGQAS